MLMKKVFPVGIQCSMVSDMNTVTPLPRVNVGVKKLFVRLELAQVTQNSRQNFWSGAAPTSVKDVREVLDRNVQHRMAWRRFNKIFELF